MCSIGRSNESLIRYYSAVPLRDFLLDSYEDFLAHVYSGRAKEVPKTRTIRTPFDLMIVVADRYLVMQRLRVLGNIDETEFRTAVRLDRNEITIRVVGDCSKNVESSKQSLIFAKIGREDRTIVRFDVDASMSRFFECSENETMTTIDSSENTTRQLFLCFIAGCAFVRSVTTARDLVTWIARMRRTLRLTNEFVVVVERDRRYK